MNYEHTKALSWKKAIFQPWRKPGRDQIKSGKGACPSPGTATSTRSDWRIRTRLPLKQVAASGLPDALEFGIAALLGHRCARDGHTPLPLLITPRKARP